MGDKYYWKVLVPVDGSDSSLLAEKTAAIVAEKTGATVTVLHVIHEVEEYYRMQYAAQGLKHNIPRSLIQEILLLSEQEANKIVNNAQVLFSKEGLTVDAKILKDTDPADRILEFSKKNYNLTIMGARGKTEKHPYLLGSVTKKVIRHTSCPTLFTKEACSLSNLLVCIDGSETSIRALNYAFKLANKIGSQITLLNVQERRLINLSSKVAEELGEQILSRALGTIEKGELKVNKRVEYGVASDIIVEVAESGNHDLIVLGNRGIGRAKRFLLGSVSDDVSHKAKSSVLIVPGKHV